jgi:hypothetical protein
MLWRTMIFYPCCTINALFSSANCFNDSVSPLIKTSWPLTKFWRSLVMFDLFWDFDRLVECGAQVEAEIRDRDLDPF